MQALDHFPPTRTEALSRLQAFLPKAGRDYAARRNYDLGPGNHSGVSGLSPYIRHRLLTEEEVLQTVLRRYALSTAEKFVQEVYWRTYWKGWLEMRPQVWSQYQAELTRALNDIQTQSGLRQSWESACLGQTGIECFDAWARELADTGYLHNHARMWFASIWIFTLRLPWVLGADFFLRHLLDGDPASNSLSWRWVGGLQTRGKTYLARTSNISKYTEGRFHPKWQLASEAQPLDGPPPPAPRPVPASVTPDTNLQTGIILHEDDLSPGFVLSGFTHALPCVVLRTENQISPFQIAPHKTAFLDSAFKECLTRYSDRLTGGAVIRDAAGLEGWVTAQGIEQIITPYAPVGPAAHLLSELAKQCTVPVVRVQRDHDAEAWPHATHGFFRFKEKIPELTAPLAA